MTTIVFAHPWHGSFNKTILNTIVAKCEKDNRPYQVIDLQNDKFNASFSEEDLSVYNGGKSLDPLVEKYQKMIAASNEIIFIFPIWWATMPAILKGFFDKVMLVNFAFSYENGWTPLLKIDKSTVITTSANKTEMFRSSIEDNFIGMMLSAIGINNTTWLNCENIVDGGDEYRADFLKKIESI